MQDHYWMLNKLSKHSHEVYTVRTDNWNTLVLVILLVPGAVENITWIDYYFSDQLFHFFPPTAPQQAIHSQTPSYRCGLCDKSYRQKNVFLHHLRNRHKVSTDVLDRRRCHIKNNAGGGVMEAVPAAPLPPPSLSSVCLPPLSPPEPPPGEAAPPVMLRISERQQALPPSSVVSSMWQCPFCAFESAHDPEVCRSHLLQHVGEPADCPLCPRQLASPQELAAHLRDFHESAGLAPILTNPAVGT